MKPTAYLLDPSTPAARRVVSIPFPLTSREAVGMLLGVACPDPVECLTLREIDAGHDLVLVRRPALGASLNEASAYQVAGHRTVGRSILCMRPKGAEPIGRHLAAATQILPAPISEDEVHASAAWEAPATGELAGRVLDVQMLDAFAKFICERAGAAAYGGVLRLDGIDQAARPAAAFNVPAGDWRAFRRAALDLYDRRWSVVSDLLVREAPAVRGGNEQTAATAEVVELKTKPGGHDFTVCGADGKDLFGAVHAEPIRKLAKRTHRAVAMPGLPLFLGDSGVPWFAEWRLAGS